MENFVIVNDLSSGIKLLYTSRSKITRHLKPKKKALSVTKRAQLKSVHEKMGKETKRNISAISRKANLHPQTVRKYQSEEDP